MRQRETSERDGRRRPKARRGTKALSCVAGIALVASMFPGAVALAYASDQLAAGSQAGEPASPVAQGDGGANPLSAQAENRIKVTDKTHSMGTGTYVVEKGEHVTIEPVMNEVLGSYGNAISIEEGAKVLLIIEEGATLTVTGSDGYDYSQDKLQVVGHAAILLPEGSTLTVAGTGTLNATGGNATRGEGGYYGYESIITTDDTVIVGKAGGGGLGGGGAGAGIGTNGGIGGWRGAPGGEVRINGLTRSNVYGNAGGPGGPGVAAKPAGTLLVTGSVTVNAKGGAASTGKAGGLRGKYYEYVGGFIATAAGTSAGGGGGGGGSAADGIGSGGTGGGGGGGGASASIDGECAFFGFTDLDDLWGHSGDGGGSAWGGTPGGRGEEGANGGDDTGYSRKYAKAGGAGGSCAEPKAVAFYTYKDSPTANPKVTCTSGNEVTRDAINLGSLEAFKSISGLASLVNGGTFAYDGKSHGASVGSGGSVSAQAEGDSEGEQPSSGTVELDGVEVAWSVAYYDEAGKQVVDGNGNPSAPVMPGSYAAVATFTSENPDYCGSWVEPIVITKRQVEKPTPAALTFECADWTTGEGAEQDAFPGLDGADYLFDGDATAADGTPSLKSAKAAGDYMACFKLADPATCRWAGEAEDAAECWVPWSIALAEFDPASPEVTYWGTAHDNETTSVAYTGEPQWVRPWFARARSTDGRFPEWLTHWGEAGRPAADRASAAVVYLKGEDDREGLVGYHENPDGSYEKVTAEQVYAWMFGAEVGGKRVPIESGDKVWYETGADGWKVLLAVGGGRPAGAEGYFVARDLAWADRLGVMDAGRYSAYAYFDTEAGFAPVSLAEATVTVGEDLSAAEVELSGERYAYDGRAKEPAVRSVSLGGRRLVAGRDYEVSYRDNVGAGEATVSVTGIGGFYGEKAAAFPIAKAPQAVSAKDVAVKAKAEKSGKRRALAKKVTVDLAKKAKVSAKTAVAYAKANKAGGKKIAVAKAGKVTLKKGLAKGTYKVRVRLTAAAGANYEDATKTVTLTVKVR